MHREPVRILYLDDSPSDIKLITSLIKEAREEFPASVDCVSTRDTFLAALRRCEHDVILCDHRMPRYNGDEALRDAQLICPDVPFIMVTGELGEELAIETLKHGATDYVLKDRLARLIPSIRRALKEAAADRERRSISRSLVEAQRMAHIGSWEWNVETGEMHWSEELYAIYGLDPDRTVLTMDLFAQFIHPEDRKLVNEKIAQVTGARVSVDFEFRIIRTDGSVRVLHTMGEVREFDAVGKPLVMAGTNQDITERTVAAQKLAESELRLRTIQEASLDGFTILRPVYDEERKIQDFVWVYENAAVARMNGTVPGEVIGKRLLELFPGHRDTRFFQAYCEVALTGKSQEFEEHYLGETITHDTWFRIVVVPGGDTIAVLAEDITARKRVEGALRESERRYRLLHETLRDAFVRVSMDGRIVECNDLYCVMLGYSPEEMQALTYRDVTPERWHDLEERIVREQILVRGYSDVYEKEYRRKDGTVFPVELRTILSRDERGWPSAMWAIVRDVSQRKQAEEALRRSQQHLEDMIRYAPTFIYEIDFRKRCFTKVNEAMCTFSGYTREEMLAKDPMEFLYEESQARFKERIAQWLRGEKPREDVEYHVKLREGDDRWVILKVTFIADEKGLPLGATVIGHDITERRRMEQALRESEEKFRALSEASPAAVIVYCVGKLLYTNPSASVISGYTHDELLSMDFMDIIPQEEREFVKSWVSARAGGDQRAGRYQLKLLTKGGATKWVDVSSALIQYEGQPAGLVISIDNTERRIAEDALRESEERFRTMANSAPIIIMVVNERGETEMVNQAFTEFFGVEETRIRSLSDWPQLIHPDDSARALALVRTLIRGRKPLEGEVRARNAKGEWRWLLVRGRPRFSVSGQFLGLVGSATDITERKRMEQNLQRSAENLRLMVQSGIKPMMVVDRGGLIEAVSEAGEFLLGYGQGELEGRNVKDMIVPLSRMEAALQLDELRKHAPRPLTATLRLLRKNGSSIWATAEVSLVVAGDGVTEKYLAKFEKLEVTARSVT